MPYKIVKKGDGVAVEMDGKSYTPEEVSAMILSKIKADAEAFLGEKVTEAIITVPAYFDDSSVKPLKTPVRLLVLRSNVLLMNLQPQPSPTVLKRRMKKKS